MGVICAYYLFYLYLIVNIQIYVEVLKGDVAFGHDLSTVEVVLSLAKVPFGPHHYLLIDDFLCIILVNSLDEIIRTKSELSLLQATSVTVMPTEKAEEIKAVMANIKLPNIPLWARQVPEEQWMTSLINNIHKGKGQSENSSVLQHKGQQVSGHMTDSISSAADEELFDANFEAHFPDS